MESTGNGLPERRWRFLSKEKEEEEEEVTDLFIAQVEKLAIPGLSQMIIMRDSSTPLTNIRFTLNTAGAIYDYNQNVDNFCMTRQPNTLVFQACSWPARGAILAAALEGR